MESGGCDLEKNVFCVVGFLEGGREARREGEKIGRAHG